MEHGRKFLKLIAAFCLFASATNLALASSFLYKFSGSIERIEYDDAALIAGAGWGIGTEIHYEMIVDFERQGEVTHNDGAIQTLQDLQLCQGCNVSTHYFFADLVSGDILRDENISPSMIPGANLKDVNGSFYSSPTVSQGSISIFGQNSVLSIFDGSSVEAWYVGKSVQVFASASNLVLQPSVFRGNLNLDSISAVPEPSSSALLLIGGMFIFTTARRMKSTASSVKISLLFSQGGHLPEPPHFQCCLWPEWAQSSQPPFLRERVTRIGLLQRSKPAIKR